MAYYSILLALTCILAPVLTEWVPEMENEGLFEGDMMLSPEQMNAARSGKFSYATTIGKQWPDKTVAYSYALDIQARPRAMEVIQEAIAEYHAKTCIRFKKRTTEKDYIQFHIGSGCSSYVGFRGGPTMPMPVSLAQGCWRKGIVVHELGHAIGIFHEQSRPDRDDHVEIQWDKIKQGMKFNFNKMSNATIDSLNTDYDYESIMHYGKTAFAKTRGLITIKTKKPSKQDVIGNRKEMSATDVFQINRLYRCGSGPLPTGGPTNPSPSTRPTKPGPTSNPDCKDSNPRSCPGWKSICASHPHIAQLCKKTCRLC